MSQEWQAEQLLPQLCCYTFLAIFWLKSQFLNLAMRNYLWRALPKYYSGIRLPGIYTWYLFKHSYLHLGLITLSLVFITDICLRIKYLHIHVYLSDDSAVFREFCLGRIFPKLPNWPNCPKRIFPWPNWAKSWPNCPKFWPNCLLAEFWLAELSVGQQLPASWVT